jgi:hypothetical protein
MLGAVEAQNNQPHGLSACPQTQTTQSSNLSFETGKVAVLAPNA